MHGAQQKEQPASLPCRLPHHHHHHHRCIHPYLGTQDIHTHIVLEGIRGTRAGRRCGCVSFHTKPGRRGSCSLVLTSDTGVYLSYVNFDRTNAVLHPTPPFFPHFLLFTIVALARYQPLIRNQDLSPTGTFTPRVQHHKLRLPGNRKKTKLVSPHLPHPNPPNPTHTHH